MSEQEFEFYLKLLSRCLSLTAAQRVQIADELRDHLEERLEELARAGVPRETAVFQALDEFGDAAVLAAHFTTIAHLKRRRFLMRLSLGSVAALAAALLVAFAFWPENRAVQGPQMLFAQNKSKPSQEQAHSQPKAPTAPAVHTDHPLSSDMGQAPAIEAALETTSDFVIDPEPLKDALDFIAHRFHIPIILDSKSLEDASIDTSTEVKLPVPGLKVRQMLTLLLGQLAQPLGFDIEDGVLRIATIEKLHDHRIVVVYDCRDLIHLRSMTPDAARSHRAEATIESTGGRRKNGGTGAGTGGGMFQVSSTLVEKPKDADRGAGAKSSEKSPEKNSEKSAEHAKPTCVEPAIPLIRVIQYAGDRDDWEDEKGEGPKITEIGGLLVVNQNPVVHEQIKRILADLRRMRKEGAFATLEKTPVAAPATAAQQGSARGL